MRSSLATVVIGGLTSSLILTLFIVPIVYGWISLDKLSEPAKIGEKKPDRKHPRPQPTQ